MAVNGSKEVLHIQDRVSSSLFTLPSTLNPGIYPFSHYLIYSFIDKLPITRHTVYETEACVSILHACIVKENGFVSRLMFSSCGKPDKD